MTLQESPAQNHPPLSAHFAMRQPSAIRVASIRFAERRDGTEAINVAIGNVSLPMHPAMIERLAHLTKSGSPFERGVVQYTATVGTQETRDAFLHVIASSGLDTRDLHCQITDGGSQAMELVLLGCCGAAGTADRPLMLIDPAYTNYVAFAQRIGRATVTVRRALRADGKFTLPAMAEIEAEIERTRPGALVVIPYDNPTGHFYDHATMVELARLCVKHNLWMISDEAYRELFYGGGRTVSVWGVTEDEVPGIKGRRISIESASKVWNACGLRIGALVTDNHLFHVQSVAENTASLCSSAIGQYIFGALAHESHAALQSWYKQQRTYYGEMLESFTSGLKSLLPGVIVSSPDAALYSIIDVRDLVGTDFEAMDFVMYCATQGAIDVGGRRMTLLTAPMGGFYDIRPGEDNPGRTQMRVAYVEPPQNMALVPSLFAQLFEAYRRR